MSSGIKAKMEDILKSRMRDSIGKDVKIVLANDWVYKGKVLNSDENYVELLDSKTGSLRVIDFGNIKEFEVRE